MRINSQYINALKKAAEKGDDKSQLELGRLYATGYGVTKNAKEAANWYRKAAEQSAAVNGNKDAQFMLARMYAQGFGVEQNDAEAVAWYRKAADQGDADAQCILGGMCADGLGVP